MKNKDTRKEASATRKRVHVFGLAALLVFLALGGAAWGASEQKVTVTMTEMSFAPAKVTLKAGTTVEFKLVNKGRVKHEFMVYELPKKSLSAEERHKWAVANSYFKGLVVKVEGGGIEVEGRDIFEVEVGRGKSAEVRFMPVKKGTFEIGCLIEGHYEAGMKGSLTVK